MTSLDTSLDKLIYIIESLNLTPVTMTMMKTKRDSDGRERERPFLDTSTETAHKCPRPQCPACHLSKAHRRTPDTRRVESLREMTLRSSHLTPGACISCDQWKSQTLGRRPETYGKEADSHRFVGGSLFYDHATQFVYHNPQVSMRVGETLQGKHKFEAFARQYGVKLKSFHADNDPYDTAEFLKDIELHDQTLTLSGAYAHHQNGVAERAVKTILSWSLTLMMHMLLRWPEAYDPALWPFALEQAVDL